MLWFESLLVWLAALYGRPLHTCKPCGWYNCAGHVYVAMVGLMHVLYVLQCPSPKVNYAGVCVAAVSSTAHNCSLLAETEICRAGHRKLALGSVVCCLGDA
jgi:hypothetical protein